MLKPYTGAQRAFGQGCQCVGNNYFSKGNDVLPVEIFLILGFEDRTRTY